VIVLISALFLVGGAPDIDAKREAGIEQMWREMSHLLEPAGITKPMFRAANVWVEGQYLIGYCNARLDPDDVRYWTAWWRDTPLERTETGRAIIAQGDKSYAAGLSAGKLEKPSAELCQRSADDWFEDMKRAAN
jgi:hypothetical protein